MNIILLTLITGAPVMVNWSRVSQVTSNEDGGSQILFSVTNEHDFHALDVKETMREIFDQVTLGPNRSKVDGQLGPSDATSADDEEGMHF